jgi:16S rRNA (cytosine967-C5)-methyltransferase
MTSRRPPRRRRAPGEADPPGMAPRRAALRLVDAILRRGDPLDVAMHAAAQGLTGADRAFAVAIASETMRWMTDIEALIDEATAQILPDDV